MTVNSSGIVHAPLTSHDPSMVASPAPSAPTRRIVALDGIRGLAILVVVVHNVAFVIHDSTAALPRFVSAITATGWVGVQLFFVLSGFLITGILLETRADERYFRNFYARRTLRIFPLYYLTLAFAFLIFARVSDPAWATTVHRNQWWYWTYTSNWGAPLGFAIPGLSHFWSLAVEEQFYLLWPLVVFSASDRALAFITIGVLATTPVLRATLLASGVPPLATYEWTIARWDALAFGAVIALAAQRDSWRAWLVRRTDLLAAVAASCLVILVLARRGFHENDVAVQVAGQTLVAALSAWLVFRGAGFIAGNVVERAASVRWLRTLGKYSYAIYVFHFPIHVLAARTWGDAVNGADTPWRLARLVAYIIGVLAASLLAALLSWHVVEQPFLRLKERFRAPHRRASASGISSIPAIPPAESRGRPRTDAT